MKEHDIRPAETAAEQKRRYEADVARLLTRRAEFVDVDCPACGASDRTAHFEKYTLVYQRCVVCNTVYISPRPPPALLEDYYSTSENYAFWNAVIFPSSEEARRTRIFAPRAQRVIEMCRTHGVGLGTLLEVGAGFGTFCEEITKVGAFRRVVAIEPTPSLAETCRRKGIDVRETTVERAELTEPVDVLASFEVIEHLFDPGKFVRMCARLIRPGGLLVLTCPNINGFDIDVLGAGSPAVDVEHLNYFHPRSLAQLLEHHGFDVVETQTPGRLDADIVRNRILAGEAIVEDRFLRRVLIDEWERLGAAFQTFLVEAGLSSNMWICGRKRAV
jgi:2-polyprenyl-3-methyl-5-hydroxy-6-metoxy-1,4-benzoquinol methylase